MRRFLFAVSGLLVACSPGSGMDQRRAPDEAATGGDDDIDFGDQSSGGGFTPPPCPGDHSELDEDGDGFRGADGDCNDCTGVMNPGARDYPGNGIDEDCNETPDDDPTDCDVGVAIDSTDATDAARAIGLCKAQFGATWGLVSAAYVTSDGKPLPDVLGHGLLTAFGGVVAPQEGKRLLALSSGAARQPSDPGYQDVGGYDKGYTSEAPPGYPKESPACPGITTGAPHDSAGLEIVVKSPTNARSVGYKLNFFTYEFPAYICSEFNDFFVALLTPAPAGSADGNISFDSQGNTISVNAGFLEVCKAQTAGGKQFPCAEGPDMLIGTGFEDRAATGWLQTTTLVESPGDNITLRFAIWDSGDGYLDSTVLLDDLTFELEETPTVTAPVDEPK